MTDIETLFGLNAHISGQEVCDRLKYYKKSAEDIINFSESKHPSEKRIALNNAKIIRTVIKKEQHDNSLAISIKTHHENKYYKDYCYAISKMSCAVVGNLSYSNLAPFLADVMSFSNGGIVAVEFQMIRTE